MGYLEKSLQICCLAICVLWECICEICQGATKGRLELHHHLRRVPPPEQALHIAIESLHIPLVHEIGALTSGWVPVLSFVPPEPSFASMQLCIRMVKSGHGDDQQRSNYLLKGDVEEIQYSGNASHRGCQCLHFLLWQFPLSDLSP